MPTTNQPAHEFNAEAIKKIYQEEGFNLWSKHNKDPYSIRFTVPSNGFCKVDDDGALISVRRLVFAYEIKESDRDDLKAFAKRKFADDIAQFNYDDKIEVHHGQIWFYGEMYVQNDDVLDRLWESAGNDRVTVLDNIAARLHLDGHGCEAIDAVLNGGACECDDFKNIFYEVGLDIATFTHYFSRAMEEAKDQIYASHIMKGATPKA